LFAEINSSNDLIDEIPPFSADIRLSIIGITCEDEKDADDETFIRR
jgi:hypothetical protein